MPSASENISGFLVAWLNPLMPRRAFSAPVRGRPWTPSALSCSSVCATAVSLSSSASRPVSLSRLAALDLALALLFFLLVGMVGRV